MESFDLKPCPFCGSSNLDLSLKSSNSGYNRQVYCKNCHTYGPRVLVKTSLNYNNRVNVDEDPAPTLKAVELWNNRV